MGRRSTVPAVSVVVAITLVVAGAATPAVTRSRTASAGVVGGAAWFDRGLRVVGGPVAAGGRVLVLVLAADRSAWLEGIDPRTGRVAWRVREGFSEITAGVEVTPLAAAGIALALLPEGGARSPVVRPEGIRVSTGVVAWRFSRPLLVTDAPTACPQPLGRRAFCLVATSAPSTAPALVALSPATGAVRATVSGIERQMSTTPGVYQMVARPSILAGIRTPGGVRWRQTVSKLFGPGYDPDYGWDFDQFGTVEAGSVGSAPSGRTLRLAAAKTIGVSSASGRRVWTDRGSFQCSGLAELPGNYLCLMTGTATETASGSVRVSRNATVAIEGFKPATGSIDWKLRVKALADLLLGNVAAVDKHRVLVNAAAGGQLVLDLRNGATTRAKSGERFWCAHANFFKVNPPAGMPPERQGSSLFTPCDAGRRPLAGLGPPSPVAGAVVGRTFIWASPAGLRAARVR
jgi:hypothetical protein